VEELAKRPPVNSRRHSIASGCKVAILGFGTVGKAVAEVLCNTPVLGLRLTQVFNRQIERKRVSWVPEDVEWTDDLRQVLASDADVVVVNMVPITPEVTQRLGDVEYVVQYTQRARLEYHPENAGKPSEVLLGLLGNSLVESRLNEDPFKPVPARLGLTSIITSPFAFTPRALRWPLLLSDPKG
jgi:hypothetical protein